jgi:hypothetical protein
MNRRQLAFIILVNAVISLAIALLVAWVIEMRRPDLEELAALYTPVPGAILAPTATLGSVAALPAAGSDEPQILVTHTPGESDQAVQSGEPDAEQIYVVQAGDSLGGIASRFGVTLDELIQANALTNPDFLFAGQRLTIPGNGGAVESSGEGSATAQGRVSVLAVENPGDLAQEAVLVGNDSDAPVNLVGWRLEKEGGPAYTFGNVTLFPGGGVRVFSANGEDDSQRIYWGQSAPVWTPGSVARLVNADGALMDSQNATASP